MFSLITLRTVDANAWTDTADGPGGMWYTSTISSSCMSTPGSFVKSFRSPGDSIVTSKCKDSFGNRNCSHFQFEGDFVCGSPSYSDPAYKDFTLTEWVSPYPSFPLADTIPETFLLNNRNERAIVTRNVSMVGGNPRILGDSSFTVFVSFQGSKPQRQSVCQAILPHLGHSLCVQSVVSVVGNSSGFAYRGSVTQYIMCRAGSPAKTYSWNGSGWYVGVSPVLEQLFPFRPTPLQCLGFSQNPTADPLGCLSRVTNCSLDQPAFSASLTYGAGSPDVGACVRELKDYLRGWNVIPPFYGGPSNLEWSDLADAAEDNCRFCDINSVAYVADLIRLAKAVHSALKGDFSSLPKTWDDLWLSGRYGLRLTVADSKDLIKGVRHSMNATLGATSHARRRTVLNPPFPGSTYVRETYYKLYYNYKQDPALVAIRKMMDWDLWPTWQNSWDLIPFSFVVDWFVDVEAVLKAEDNNIYEQYINVESVIYTYKDIVDYPPEMFDLSLSRCVNARAISYQRRHGSILHYAPLRVQRGHLTTTNVIDGVTLLIQKR